MDNNLIIYSSIFVLVIFVFLKKIMKYNLITSLSIPLGFVIMYILFINKTGNITDLLVENNLEVLTDLPDF